MSKTFVAIYHVTLLCFSQVLTYSQNNAGPTFELTGKVSNGATGVAVPRALVEYTGFVVPQSSNEQKSVAQASRVTTLQGSMFTDASGVFHFSGLPSANYNLVVSRPQFETKRENVRLEKTAKDIQVLLSHLAVVSGTATDGEGKPLHGVNIGLFQVHTLDGRRTLIELRSVATDDLGQYRLWNIQPGHYLLKAVGRSGGTSLYSTERLPSFSAAECFLPIYYGGSTDWRLTAPLDFGAKNEVVANFQLVLQPARSIRGNVSGLTSFQTAKFELLDSNNNVVATRAALSGVAGSFELLDVPAGTYLLRVTQGDGAAKVYGEGQADVSKSDTESIKIFLRAGTDVTVVLHCQVKQSELAIPCATLTLVRSDSDAVGRTDQRNLLNVPAGKYEYSTMAFGEYVTSVRANGRDMRPGQKLTVSEGMGPVEVSTAKDGGSIEVQVDLPDQVAASDVGILVVPLFDSFRGPTRLGSSAKVQTPDFAPGDYSVYALHNSDMESLEYRNPEALRMLVPSAALRIEANGHHTVPIRSLAK